MEVAMMACGRWMKTNPKLRLGLLTRLPLRAGATGASNPSFMAVEVNGGSGRRGGRTWSFEWGLTPDSISESMHSELQTRPQRRGRAEVGLRHLTLGGGAWHLTKCFQKFGDNIAKATMVS